MPDYDTDKDHEMIRYYDPADYFVPVNEIQIPTFTMRKRDPTSTRFVRRDR